MRRAGLILALAPLFAAAALFVRQAAMAVPQAWPRALFSPDPEVLAQLVLHLSDFPRFVAALLAGAILAIAGQLMQRLLANPLAEAGTLGVFAGAQAALTAAAIWTPALIAAFGPAIALAGAFAAFALVLALAARQGFSAAALILSGMVVTLSLGGLAATLTLFHHEVMQGLFLWQAGSLAQDGWGTAAVLAAVLAVGLAAAAPLRRPLALLETGEETARGLGLRVAFWRAVVAVLAVSLAAAVTVRLGVIGFIGLLAPLLARLAGGGRAGLSAVALTGAGLLALCDQLVRLLPPFVPLQTGSLVALGGSVVLLALLPRLRPSATEATMPMPAFAAPRLPLPLVAAGAALLLWLALAVGRTPEGWSVAFSEMLPWRLARVLAAIAAGAAFGLAGALLQRLLANPMAGPELLGVGAAAAFGLVLAVLFGGAGSRIALFLATAAGAGVALVLIAALTARLRFSPRHLLLIGLGVSTLVSALLAMVLAEGNPLAGRLLNWLAGSTYRVALPDAALALAAAGALTALVPLLRRWLDILPLGLETAKALGVNLRHARLAIMLAAAAATAIGTLLIGPLGFIGLLAPHLARAAGAGRAAVHVPASAAFGAGLLLLADWLGRVAAFPWEIPAGQVALVLGSVLLCAFLWRARR